MRTYRKTRRQLLIYFFWIENPETFARSLRSNRLGVYRFNLLSLLLGLFIFIVIIRLPGRWVSTRSWTIFIVRRTKRKSNGLNGTRKEFSLLIYQNLFAFDERLPSDRRNLSVGHSSTKFLYCVRLVTFPISIFDKYGDKYLDRDYP